MAHRFFFDLTKGFETIRDHKGVEAGNLDQAVEEAQAVLDEMRRNGVLSEDEEGWLLSIKDVREVTLMTLAVTPRSSSFAMAS